MFPIDFFLSHILRSVLTLVLMSPMVLVATKVTAMPNRALGEHCEVSEAKKTDGHRRLALIVGVGEYKSPKIKDLKGPSNDAQSIYELLTGKNGYGFPKENVCMLLDKEATTARFKQAFEEALIKRAEDGDVVVVFYAGHGSQRKDKNGDEPDEWDETFLFHDARTSGVRDYSDDEFNTLLARLHSKTDRITMILDSCNSGTAVRAATDDQDYVARFQPTEAEQIESGEPVSTEKGDTGGGWVPESLPGMVAFTAAKDGTSALERAGRGIFTSALVKVLSEVRDKPLTYAQVARQTPLLVAAQVYQVPFFHGDLSGPVFGNKSRNRPVSWEVITVGPPVKLGGLPLPGLGQGAEFRIYDGSATGADTNDPGKAKATVVVDDPAGLTALTAKAHVTAAKTNAQKIAPGDLAVLVRPSDEQIKIRVRLRPANEPGGIPATRSDAIQTLITKNQEANMLTELTATAGDFELSLGSDGEHRLQGPENRVRNVFSSDLDVPISLWQHARQKALLQLGGEGGSEFIDNETLQVQLVPAPSSRQSQCANGSWVQAKPNREQIIPLCHAWNVKVRLSDSSPMPLLVGGVILSTDGSTFGFPFDGRKVLLNPGEETTFNAWEETFEGTPPLDIWDRVIVFGTQETNPVPWHLITTTAITREAGPPKSPLYRALNQYLQVGTRGQKQKTRNVEDTTWTLSSVMMRVEANQRFLQTDSATASGIDKREYTIAKFDIRPYLPDDKDTALYKILKKAHWLANTSARDGIGYKQHPWKKTTDKENLALGIDCSRAIWFAFTRAGYPYNSDNRYLSTAMMVTESTAMNEQFESCSNDPMQPGDILVYRDDTRGDGHVVMVIDPEKRIAWGSHGWDGNPKKLKIEPDTGVEYQKIKYKTDWQRWDRRTMEYKACWRYRKFIQERTALRGVSGTKVLNDICNPNKKCGVGSY